MWKARARLRFGLNAPCDTRAIAFPATRKPGPKGCVDTPPTAGAPARAWLRRWRWRLCSGGLRMHSRDSKHADGTGHGCDTSKCFFFCSIVDLFRCWNVLVRGAHLCKRKVGAVFAAASSSDVPSSRRLPSDRWERGEPASDDRFNRFFHGPDPKQAWAPRPMEVAGLEQPALSRHYRAAELCAVMPQVSCRRPVFRSAGHIPTGNFQAPPR